MFAHHLKNLLVELITLSHLLMITQEKKSMGVLVENQSSGTVSI